MSDRLPTNGGHRTPATDPRDLLAVMEQLLRGMTGTRVPVIQLQPFQFPSIQHLDNSVKAAIQRATEVEGLSSKSARGYAASYRQFRAYLRETKREYAFLSGQAQSQIGVLEGWIGWLRNRGVSHTTVNTYWRALHAPLTRVAQQGGMLTPTRLVATPKPGATLPEFLTSDALAAVFRFVRNYQWKGAAFERDRNVALLATMSLGGCRLREVLHMNVADVDLSSVAPNVRIPKGKGIRGGKPRVVCLPPELAMAMATYLDLRARRKVATTRVFVSTRADRPIAEITIRRLCVLITKKTGIKVAPHLLRHTCATWMRQQGVTDRLAMEQLGHSSLGVLQRYSHIAPGERAEIISRLRLGVAHASGQDEIEDVIAS